MDLSQFEITSFIYSQEDTIVARANPHSEAYDASSVIIKYQNTDYPSAELDARWKNEFNILRTIKSKWVIKAHSLLQYKNSHILVLEDFSSTTLSDLIAANTLTLKQKIQIACQLTSAIADVHNLQLIHRDLNPSNILLDPETLELKLCDFALATRLSHKQVSLFNQDLWGKFEYISPEQTGRTNLKVDYRSDFYSLGITLYELFSGRLPFTSSNPMALLHSHLARSPEPLETIKEDVPQVISAIVNKLMAKSPDNRYQSTFGLQTDLNNCATQWNNSNSIDYFTLAASDVSMHFNLSTKLYGRDSELSEILATYQRACSIKTEITMVSGYSGVGKSALVNELQKSIIANDALFVMGKCDQYNRGQPFLVLIEALQQLLQHLLSENATKLNQWRSKLQTALGNNAAIITELLPDLALIINTPPTLTTLPPAEAEMRLNMVFTDFFNVLYSEEYPLVIFLDDLQWVDMPTLNFLELVSKNQQCGLYVIGAYRDNEVDDAHPLKNTLTKVDQADVLNEINLTPLKLEHLQNLICNTLHSDFDKVSAIAKLSFDKTQGNPFYLNQFLLSIYQKGAINYDHVNGKWQWDIEAITKHSMTDNVVDLMIEKFKSLAPETQLLASIASHLGHNFSLRQLSSACKYDTLTTAKILWPLLEFGFILPQDEHYQYTDNETSLIKAHYCFLHDKVQQAAYQLTPVKGREQLLLHIGKHWLENITETELNANLFTLLHVLNGAVNIIDDQTIINKIISLNLRAGLKSKDAATYDIAANYLRKAKALLTKDSWFKAPKQTLNVHKSLIETEFLAGNTATARSLYLDSIKNSQTNMEKITLILVQAEQFQSTGNFPEAINVLMEGLDILQVNFPKTEQEAEQSLQSIYTKTQALRQPFTDDELITANKMSDEHYLLCMEIHNALAPALYLSGKACSYATNACSMVQITLAHGQCELSSIGYAAYATAMSMMGEKYPVCYEMSKLAKDVSDLWDSKYHRATIYQYFASSYQHWCEPIENTYAYQEQVIAWGEEGTNLVFAGYCVLFKACNKFIKGEILPDLRKDIEQGLAFLTKKQQPATVNFVLLGAYQSLLALQGKTLPKNSLNSQSFNIDEYFAGNYNAPSMDTAFYTFATLRYAYLMDDKSLQMQAIKNVDIVCMFLPDSPIMTESLFYQALIILDDIKTPASSEDEPNVDQLGKAEQICQKLHTWSLHSTKNYQHKYCLVAAELARVKQQGNAAEELYIKALDSVELANCIHDEALINERYANYWLTSGQSRIATHFIRDAHYLYGRWGAVAKCNQLEKRWPQQRFTVINANFDPRDNLQTSIHNPHIDYTQSLDLHSLLIANQHLSEEIYVDSLLEKLMHLLMENAGAQNGAIILHEEGQLQLEIVGKINDESAGIDSQLYNINLDDIAEENPPILPDTLIRYTQKTMKTLILDNPSQYPRFFNNSYLKINNPKSVLCLPVTGQGKLVAIVYLENNLIAHAFTKKHKDTVELIAAQAAVSLINARHYETLENKVAQRTAELKMLAVKDGLTGIYNRREFDNTLAKEWNRASREYSSLSLMMIDIDHFKAYNDNYGHPEGDACIRLIASALSEVVARKNDFVARYGGEEFVILMTTSERSVVENLAKRCIEKIEKLAIPHQYSDTAEHITVSIGIATLEVLANQKPSALIKQADSALYQSKENGRNRYTCAPVLSKLM